MEKYKENFKRLNLKGSEAPCQIKFVLRSFVPVFLASNLSLFLPWFFVGLSSYISHLSLSPFWLASLGLLQQSSLICGDNYSVKWLFLWWPKKILVWIFKLGWNLLVQMAHVPDLSPRGRLVLWLRKHCRHQFLLSPTGQDTDRDFTTYLPLICFLSTLVQFPWTDILFRSFRETVVCAACVPCFFLAVYRPVSHTVSLS